MRNRHEEDFRFLAENCADMVCRVGDDLIMHYASPSCERILGWKPEDMVGKGPDSFVHPQDLQTVAAAHRRLMENGIDLTPTHIRMRHKEGGYVWMEVNARLAPRDEGKLAGDIVLTMRASAARGEDLVSRQAFSIAPLPMAILEHGELRILRVNESFSHLTGYAPEAMQGRTVAETQLLLVPPHPQQSAGKTPFELGCAEGIEVQLRHRNGGIITCRLWAATTTFDEGDYVLAVFYHHSLSQNRSEIELKAAIESVMQEAGWFSQAVVEKLAQLRRPRPQAPDHACVADLTSREREILGLVCQGLTDSEISDFLNLSHNTIRNHLASIYSKIDVHRRAAAIVWARQRGIYG